MSATSTEAAQSPVAFLKGRAPLWAAAWATATASGAADAVIRLAFYGQLGAPGGRLG